MFPVSEANFFSKKNTVFLSTAAKKQQRRLTNMTNPTMVCSYHSSCIDLPVALVGFQVDGCPSRLNHVCQGEYVLLNYIDFDGSDRNICRDSVDEIRGREKSETLEKVVDRTVYGTEES